MDRGLPTPHVLQRSQLLAGVARTQDVADVPVTADRGRDLGHPILRDASVTAVAALIARANRDTIVTT